MLPPARSAAALALLALASTPLLATDVTRPQTAPGGKVVITSCAVMFGLKSSGSSATRAGAFNTDRRSEVTLTKVYEMAGVDTSSFQRITDDMCGGAPAALTAAGYEVVTEGLREHYAWQDSQERGQTSPRKQKAGDTEYQVFAPTGLKIVDPFVVGGMAQGRLVWNETTLGNALNAKPVSILFTVDFAELQATNTRGRMRDQDAAVVTASVALTVGASVASYDASEGNVKCGPLGPTREQRNKPVCQLKRPRERDDNAFTADDSTSRRFPDAIVSVERQSMGVGGAVLGATNVLAGMAGSRRQQLQKYTVTVDATKYEEATTSGAAGILADAMKWIHEPESRPRPARGRR